MGLRFDPVEEARRNWQRHHWGAVDAMATATSITRAHQIVLSRIDAALAPHDLTFSRFEALALLAFSSRGELPLGKMGDRLQVHPASITNTVDRLEKAGLVERRRHPTDGRTRLAVLLPAGRALVEAAAESLASINFGLAELPVGAQNDVVDALATLRHQAGDFETG